MVNFKIVGINLTAADTQVDPVETVETTTMELVGNTNGKMHLKLIDEDPETPNVIGLLFNGEWVDIRNNEKYMGTNTNDGNGVYAFDIPMRFIHEAPKPATYKIEFLAGIMENEKFTIEDTFGPFFLVVLQDDALPGEYVED